MKNESDKLLLLNDMPIDEAEDKFHHRIHAQILKKILNSNKSGLAIGLFGKWGQGKSSVISILEGILSQEFTVVVFNAWKARGDTVRRQLILQVLKRINKKEYEEISRFIEPGIPLKIRPVIEQEKYKSSKLWWILTVHEKLDHFIIGAILIGLISLGVFLTLFFKALSADSTSNLSIWALGTLVPIILSIIAVVFRWFRNRKQLLLTSAEPVSDSQRLKYPEQFQRVFEENVSEFTKSGNKLLVVVDDLDRCDPVTIVEALSAIRQFSGRPSFVEHVLKCQFLVPCDEMQVVLALEAAGHDAGEEGGRFHDYKSEELLRKFFDVTVRMHDLLPEDLSEYAASLANSIGLDEQEAREIVGLVNPRDPRLLKKLLNALRISHERIKLGQAKGLFPQSDDLPNLASTERLLVALQETKPEVYQKIILDLSLLNPSETGDKWEILLNKNDGLWECFSDGRKMIVNAGMISDITAHELIYGQLPKELRQYPLAGQLIRSFKGRNEEEFKLVLSETTNESKVGVQHWLSRETSNTQSSTGLLSILNLFLSFPDSKDNFEFIAPCVEKIIHKKSYLGEVFMGFSGYSQLESLLPYLTDSIEQEVYRTVVEHFISNDGKSDKELKFLLSTCNRIDIVTAKKFQQWLENSVQTEKNSNKSVLRLYQHMPQDTSKCEGFAPELALLVAAESEWENNTIVELQDDPAMWPRYNIITTFVGKSAEHAVRCIDELLHENGQLGTPQEISKNSLGIYTAWKTVGYLIKLISSDELNSRFAYIRNWLRNQSQPEGIEIILDALGEEVYRLGSDQASILAQFLSSIIQVRPTETYPITFIGKKPSKASNRIGWKSLVNEFINHYFRWLEVQSALLPHMSNTLMLFHQMQWPISEKTEDLLIQKLQTLVPAFDSWLDTLAQLVGKRRVKIRDSVRNCLRRNQHGKEALLVGNRVLWKTGIDIETASIVGEYFIINQSNISAYNKEWSVLKDKSGSGRVLETMQDRLPEEAEDLVGYTNVLKLISDGFDKLDKQHKRSFLEHQLLCLVTSSVPHTKHVGFSYATKLPVVTRAFKKKLQESLGQAELPEAIQEKAEEILKKRFL